MFSTCRGKCFVATSWKVLMQHTEVTASRLPPCVVVSFEPMLNSSNLSLQVCLLQFVSAVWYHLADKTQCSLFEYTSLDQYETSFWECLQQISICCREYEDMVFQITSGYACHWGNSETDFTNASEVPPVIRYAPGISGMPTENVVGKGWSISGTRPLANSWSILARSHPSGYSSSQSTSHDCLQASGCWSLHPTQLHIWQVWGISSF